MDRNLLKEMVESGDYSRLKDFSPEDLKIIQEVVQGLRTGDAKPVLDVMKLGRDHLAVSADEFFENKDKYLGGIWVYLKTRSILSGVRNCGTCWTPQTKWPCGSFAGQLEVVNV
jgi:hypothetical protein